MRAEEALIRELAQIVSPRLNDYCIWVDDARYFYSQALRSGFTCEEASKRSIRKIVLKIHEDPVIRKLSAVVSPQRDDYPEWIGDIRVIFERKLDNNTPPKKAANETYMSLLDWKFQEDNMIESLNNRNVAKPVIVEAIRLLSIARREDDLLPYEAARQITKSFLFER